MDSETKTKLDAVLAKESGRRKAAAAERMKHDAEERGRDDRKKAARARWEIAYADIQTAVNEINQSISSNGMSFQISEGKKADPAIAQLFITLSQSQPNHERQVVLNVNAFGSVHPVFLIPHAGKAPQSFELEQSNANFFGRLLVDFLDQALAFADRNPQSR